MLEAIEGFFLFKPIKATKGWNEPSIPQLIEDVSLVSRDGNKIHCWWVPPPKGYPNRATLYCHGNGGNLSYRFEGIRRWHELLQVGVLAFDYPGYGKSTGSPSEEGCHLAAKAALDFLAKTKSIPGNNLVYYGGSLGGAIATKLAMNHPPACLVINSAFTSFQAMAKKLYPWLPGLGYLKTKLNTLEWLKLCKCPTFIAHGTADRLVPFSMGLELFDAAPPPKYFHPMKDQDHHHSPNMDFYGNLKTFLGW